jgi:tight adherence protein C
LANRANGTFHDAIHGLCKNLDLGASFNDELNSLCELLPTSGVKDFANKLSIALNRGTPLASSLDALAHSLRRKFYNELLSRAGSNETKMMVPLVALVLPVTVLFALYPSVGVLQINI